MAHFDSAGSNEDCFTVQVVNDNVETSSKAFERQQD